MKNRLIILMVMLLLLGLAIGDLAVSKADALIGGFAGTFYGGDENISLIDEDTPRATRSIELPLPGEEELKKLVIDNEMGDFKVRAVPGEDFGIKGKLTVYAMEQDYADAYLSQIGVEINRQGNNHHLILSEPHRPIEVFAVKQDMEILVPGHVDLEALTHQGLVQVDGIRGSVEVDARFGQIELWALGGDVKVTGMHSEIAVWDIGGNLSVQSYFQETQIRDVAGMLELTTNHTDYNVENIGHGAKIFSRFGNGRVDGVAGELEYVTEHANLRLTQITGGISGFSRHGRISIREPQQGLDLKAEFTDLELLLSARSDFKITGESEHTNLYANFDLVMDSGDRLQTYTYQQGVGRNIYRLDTRHGRLELLFRD